MGAPGSNYSIFLPLNKNSAALSEDRRATECIFDYNVTDDGPARGRHSMPHWRPR